MLRRLLILCLYILVVSNVFGQTGPAGVGSTLSNVLWMKADDISSLANGDDIVIWTDVSGNGNDLSQPDPTSFSPVYVTSQINGLPVVRFNKFNGRIRRTGFTGFPTTAISLFYINRTMDSNDGLVSYNSTSDNDFLMYSSNSLRMYRAGGNNVNSGIAFNDNAFHVIGGSWRSSDGSYEIWDDGNRSFSGTGFRTGTSINAGGSLAIGGEQDAQDGAYAANQSHNGDFAEVIIYNTFLNQAQKIIVNNYLSTKYGITISNDYYGYDLTHSNELAGIGRETATDTHTAARSADILQIENATGLDTNQEYLLFGHDAGDVTTWTSVEAPNAGVDIQRLAREWRLDETGDVGNMDFRVETTGFPANPTGLSMYVLMIDDDGDFSSGAAVYEMSLDTGTEYVASNIAFNDGDYVAVAVLRPTVSHESATSSGAEDTSPTINVALNFIPASAQTVQATTADISATAGADYTGFTNQVINFPAGTSTANYTVSITNDGAIEPGEELTITLSNPSSSINLGNIPTHTYTILDNDNSLKVYYDVSTSSAAENTGTATVQLSLSAANNVTITTVDYTVTGGTAISSDDYAALSGTVTFPLGVTTESFTINLLDDGFFETDETIIIDLTNPVNANLDNTAPFTGTGIIQHIFTITNDDAQPVGQFTGTSDSNLENVGVVNIPVELDVPSGLDVHFNFTVSGSATGGGVDHNLANGSVIIPAGSTTADISFSIVNDLIDENTETVIITLNSASGASLGINTVFTYNIINNPTFGFTGPGGVGNTDTNILWLRPNDFDAGTDGEDVTRWIDFSGNGNDVEQTNVAFAPAFLNNIVNDYPIVRFNTAESTRLVKGSFADFPTSEISVLFANNTTDSGEGLISYASTASANNFLLYNSSGLETYLSSANVSSSTNFNGGAWQIGQVDWSTVNGLEVWKDGNQVYTNATFATGNNITPGGTLAIGAEQDSQDGGYDNTQFYDGDFAEVIIYNASLNQARKLIVQNYLSAKLDIALTSNDLYTQDNPVNGDYDYEVAGIGRISSTEQHLDAKGTGIVRINNADDLNDGEFMFWGHNNDILRATNTDVSVGVLRRLERVWRVSELNTSASTIDVGSVDVSFDLTGLGNVELDELVLLVDGDGVFSTGATIISNPVDDGGNVYRFTGVSALADGVYFTLGTRDQFSTPLPVELLYVEAKTLKNEHIQLIWKTAEEIDNSHFVIERSASYNDFKDIGIVAGAGTTSAISSYEFIDESPLDGNNYYRLRQVDFGGTFKRSEIVFAFSKKAVLPLTVKLRPNPVNKGVAIRVSLEGQGETGVRFQIISTDGRIFTPRVESIGGSNYSIATSEMMSGIYLLQVQLADGQHETVKLWVR